MCTQGFLQRARALCHTIICASPQVWSRRGYTIQDLRLINTTSHELCRRNLAYLPTFKQLRSLTIRVHTDEDIRLLGQLQQLEVLVFDTIVKGYTNTSKSEWLRPLSSLTKLRYFKWHCNVHWHWKKDTFNQFGHAWHQLRILDTDLRLGSLADFVHIRRVSTHRHFDLDYVHGWSEITCHIHDLLTLTHSDVDIQFSVSKSHIYGTYLRHIRENAYEEWEQMMHRFGLGIRPHCRYLYVFSPQWNTPQPGDIVEPEVVALYIHQLCLT